jgi:indolepyruvate ferredoxin oxidoreductase, beta subunit
MTDVKSILIVGVGGQGTILVGKILSQGLVDAGYDVKMSEVHGMSQRGGSVSTQVRFGKKVYSPIMELGSADFIVAFETLEGMRWLEYLKPSGKLILNDFKIPSAPILLGKASYPENIIDTLREKADVTVVNAAGIAEELGDSRTMNVVLLGVLVKAIHLPESHWEEVIRKEVKVEFVDVNLKAFHAGYHYA